MKIERLESYKIIIALDVMLTVTKIRIGNNALYFEICSEGVIIGNLYPTADIIHRISWHTEDDIDPLFVQQIGQAIEQTEQ